MKHSVALRGSLLVALAVAAAVAEPARLDALIFSGQNNHNWRQTTPLLQQALEACGRFAVEVTEHPEQCTAESLARFDVLISNWNAWGEAPVKEWPESTREAVLGFVRAGKGYVVVHAGSSSFYDWPDYQRMSLASWALGQTGHGRPHQFHVRVADPNHAITHGMKIFLTRDELWHRAGVQPGAKPLAVAYSAKEPGGSGKDEPLVLVGEFGEGRCCTLLLGHDAQAVETAGFRGLLCRGAEWAATGAVTLPPEDVALSPAELDFVLSQVRQYKSGGRRDALLMLEYHVGLVANDDRAHMTATRLAELAQDTEAAMDGRKFALQQLSLIGAADQVPALAALLDDEALGLHARSALERMPGEESLSAMRAAMAAATGQRRVGLINSLGARRDAGSLAAFSRLARDADPATASAATAALGRLGSREALAALEAIDNEVPELLRPTHTRALLSCADSLSAAGEGGACRPVYQRLLAAGHSAHVRGAAFVGLVRCSPGEQSRLVVGALTGEDGALRRAGVRALQESDDGTLLTTIAGRLDELATDAQARVIELFAARKRTDVLPAVVKAVGSQDSSVRLAALQALGVIGDVPAVAPLSAAAATADREELRVIEEALARLPGEGVDEALVAAVRTAPPASQRQFIRALVVRSVSAAVPTLLELAEGETEVRREALDAVGRLGAAETCPDLLRLLEVAGDADRGAVEQALLALCLRTSTVTPVLAAAKSASGAGRASLVRVLGAFGGPEALTVVREAARSEDSAVRAAGIESLAAWEDDAPLEQLVSATEDARDAAERATLLRGVSRLIPLAKARSQVELLSLVNRAIARCKSRDEKRLLLPAIGSLASLSAMAAAQKCAADDGLREEASLAALQVAERIFREHRAETEALARQLQEAENATIRGRAVALLLKIAKADNLALGARATSPDDLSKDGAAGGDQAAIDGDPTTYWDEENGKKLYILRIELQRKATVSALRILGYQHHGYAPRDFQIVCDDKPVKEVKDAEYQENLLTVVLPEVECSTVELRITGYYGESPAIRELEIFSRPPPKE